MAPRWQHESTAHTVQSKPEDRMSEMRKQNRFATLFRIGALTMSSVLVLGACSSAGPIDEQEPDNAEGPVERLVLPIHQSPWLDAFKEVAALYTDETGVEVELREFPNDEMRTTQINDVRSGSNNFDIYLLDEVWMQEFFKNDWVEPFNEVDPGYVLPPEVGTYDNMPFWNAETNASSDGELVAAPINGNLHLFMYRKDLYDQLGMTVPTTWDEVLQAGDQAQSSGEAEFGYSMRLQAIPGSASITFDFAPLLFSHGGDWFADEGTDWTPAMETPEAIAAATTLSELAQLGPAETTTMGQAEAIAAIQASRSMQTHLVAAAAAQIESESDSNVAGEMGYAVVPAGGSQEHGSPGSAVWALTVPKDLPDERAQAALEFIDWIESYDAQLLFAQNGGIPTRSDVLRSGEFEGSQAAYFEAVADSIDHARPPLRYWFSAQMLEVTEPALGAIASGEVSPEEGMAQLQVDLEALMTDLDLPMGEA